MKHFLLLFICMALSYPGKSQEKKAIQEFSTPFESTTAQIFQQQIEEIGKKATIIGLGEVSHYTRECYQLKETAVLTLMQQGYDGLVLEVDFGQALLWNDYIVNGVGNLQELLETSGWFTYRTEEFKSLLEKIKLHNDTSEKKFQIFGMEMTAMHNNLDWLKIYLDQFPELSETIAALVNQERQVVAFHNYSEKERTDYWNLYYRLKEFLALHKEQLVQKSGSANFETAQHITEISRQYATYISQDDFGLKSEFRDQFSARNVGWFYNQLPENSKLVLWAHNGHIAKTSPLFNYNVVGHYLQRWFGDAYYAVGFTFNSGEFGAFSNQGFKKWNMPSVTQESLTVSFAQLQSPFLFFNAREALASDKNTTYFLRSPVTIRKDISESFSEEQNKLMQLNISETYDGIIYIENTTYPTTITYKSKI